MIWRRTSRRVFHSSSCGIPSPRLTLVQRRRTRVRTPKNVEAPPAAAVEGRRNSLHGEPHPFLLAIPSLRVAPFLTNPAGNARKTRSHERVFHSSSCGIPSPRLTLARRRRACPHAKKRRSSAVGYVCVKTISPARRIALLPARYSVTSRCSVPYESRRERQKNPLFRAGFP